MENLNKEKAIKLDKLLSELNEVFFHYGVENLNDEIFNAYMKLGNSIMKEASELKK